MWKFLLSFLLFAAAPATAQPGADQILRSLHITVLAACPDIVGVSMNNTADKSRWTIWYTPTASCQNSALAALQLFDPAGVRLEVIVTRDAFIRRFTDAEITALATLARTNNAVNALLIRIQSMDQIDLAAPTTKARLDALVQVGILTPERAAEILAP